MRRRNTEWIAWRGGITIVEHGRNASLGRNFAYKPIVVKQHVPLENRMQVEITRATKYSLTGNPATIK